MQNGFAKGFIDIPGKKYYKYHGLNKDCNIQPEPENFLEEPLNPADPRWVLVIDEIIGLQLGDYLVKYEQWWFKPSIIGDPCFHGWPDGKRRYYFFEVDVYGRGYPEFWNINWSDGLNCCFDGGSSTRPHIHFEYSKLVWFGWDVWNNYIISFNNIAGANVKVWASTTGELPLVNPSPEGYYF